MATIYVAKGTTLSFDPVTPSTYVTIGNLTSVSHDGGFGDVEVTNLGSSRKQYRPTLQDVGEATFELQLDPGDTTHAALKTAYLAGAVHLWKITYPDVGTTTDIASGFINKYSPNAGGAEEVLTLSITVKFDGTTVS